VKIEDNRKLVSVIDMVVESGFIKFWSRDHVQQWRGFLIIRIGIRDTQLTPECNKSQSVIQSYV